MTHENPQVGRSRPDPDVFLDNGSKVPTGPFRLEFKIEPPNTGANKHDYFHINGPTETPLIAMLDTSQSIILDDREYYGWRRVARPRVIEVRPRPNLADKQPKNYECRYQHRHDNQQHWHTFVMSEFVLVEDEQGTSTFHAPHMPHSASMPDWTNPTV